ncbi:MAG: hypothetical protein IJS19_00315 [Muribaculaceae bacterium]|nr:hypothetical protein [Muribaculaceae bacterium]
MTIPIYLIVTTSNYQAADPKAAWSLFVPADNNYYRHTSRQFLLDLPEHYIILPDKQGVAQIFPADDPAGQPAVFLYGENNTITILTARYGYETFQPQAA